MFHARYLGGGKQTKQTRMKRIEAVVKRSALDDFHRCAKQLGIFGFDLSENPTKRRDHQRLAAAGEYTPDATSRVKVDFAVLDEETKPTVHAVLESVHPDSIAIFKFDQDTQPPTLTWRAAQSRW
jgi:nitrogen regulatory protein PII